MKEYPQTQFAILQSCPICNKEYDRHWKIINHIRKTHNKKHQNFLEKQELEVFESYKKNCESSSNIFKILNSIDNIFAGIAYGKIMNIVNKFLNRDELEILRKNRISQTMSGVPKTQDHNNNVSLAVKQAWKDGKFDTEECEEARRKGYAKRRSFSGKGNPMYGKPSPKGAGKGKGGIRLDIGHYVRSTWEANMSRIYQMFTREYEYETKRFYITLGKDSFSYCPDFYFADKDRYYEIKGHAKSSEEWTCPCTACVKNRIKMEEVVKEFGIKITIIGRKEYNMFKRRFKNKINWEK